MSENRYLGFDSTSFTDWMKRFLAGSDRKPQFYRNSDGDMLLILGPFAYWRTDDEMYLGNSLFVSQDGHSFRQMQDHGYGGSNKKHHRQYEDPATLMYYHLFFENNIITRFEFNSMEDVSLSDVFDNFEHLVPFEGEIPEDAVFLPVPEVRVPEYLCQFEDGRYLYVDAVKYGYTYDHLRLFIGTPENMEQQLVVNFMRYRDGGTTVMVTKAGVFVSPTPFDKVGVPTWSIQHEDNQKNDVQGLARLDHKKPENIALIESFNLQLA